MGKEMYGTYRCGHKGTYVNKFIKPRGFKTYEQYYEWAAAREFSGLCPECEAKARAAQSEADKKTADEAGYPELVGTPKQIAWAETLRMKFCKTVSECMGMLPFLLTDKHGVRRSVSKEKASEIFEFGMRNPDFASAKFWIDNRNYPGAIVGYFCEKYEEENKKVEAEAKTEAVATVAAEAQKGKKMEKNEAKKMRAYKSMPEEISEDMSNEVCNAVENEKTEIREIRSRTGLSRTAFARKYEIPLRTIENWEAGRARCPGYIVKFLGRIVDDDIKQGNV